MAEREERRAAERYPVTADVTCPMLSPVVENFGAVKVRDVSMHGVGLVVSRRVEAGALLTVVLVNQARNFNKTVLVRVAHVTPMVGGFLFIHASWHAIFWFLTAIGAVLWVANFRLLPETLHASQMQPFNARSLLRGYWTMGSSARSCRRRPPDTSSRSTSRCGRA